MIEYLDKLLDIGQKLIGLELEIIASAFIAVAAFGFMWVMICGFKQWADRCMNAPRLKAIKRAVTYRSENETASELAARVRGIIE